MAGAYEMYKVKWIFKKFWNALIQAGAVGLVVFLLSIPSLLAEFQQDKIKSSLVELANNSRPFTIKSDDKTSIESIRMEKVSATRQSIVLFCNSVNQSDGISNLKVKESVRGPLGSFELMMKISNSLRMRAGPPSTQLIMSLYNNIFNTSYLSAKSINNTSNKIINNFIIKNHLLISIGVRHV